MTVRGRDDLFTLDPSDFVAARDRFAKELREDGDREAAAAVKQLRRPPVPVWALNQVARQAPDDVDAFIDAASRARDAQAEAIAGGGGDRLRDALATQRETAQAIARKALEAIVASGRSEATYERDIDEGLTSIASTPALQEAFRNGVLTTVESEDRDVGLFADLAASMPSARPPKVVREPSRAFVRAREDVERNEAAVAGAAHELTAADAALAEAEAELASAERAAAAARRDRNEAQARYDRAERKLSRSREKLREFDG